MINQPPCQIMQSNCTLFVRVRCHWINRTSYKSLSLQVINFKNKVKRKLAKHFKQITNFLFNLLTGCDQRGSGGIPVDTGILSKWRKTLFSICSK